MELTLGTLSSTCVPLGRFDCTDKTQSWNGTCCTFGEYYAETVSRIKSSLAKIEAGDFDYLIPSLSTRGFDMAGFLYVSRGECVVSYFITRAFSYYTSDSQFQGFNDVIDRKGLKINEHEQLLKLYMSDMRSEEHGLNSPNLPFVIGQLGMHGLEKDWSDEYRNKTSSVRVQNLRLAQANACTSTPNAKLAQTSKFMYTPAGHSHYRNRADTYYAMGVSMGETMRDMVYTQQRRSAHDVDTKQSWSAEGREGS